MRTGKRKFCRKISTKRFFMVSRNGAIGNYPSQFCTVSVENCGFQIRDHQQKLQNVTDGAMSNPNGSFLTGSDFLGMESKLNGSGLEVFSNRCSFVKSKKRYLYRSGIESEGVKRVGLRGLYLFRLKSSMKQVKIAWLESRTTTKSLFVILYSLNGRVQNWKRSTISHP